jgi:hypothetical protein
MPKANVAGAFNQTDLVALQREIIAARADRKRETEGLLHELGSKLAQMSAYNGLFTKELGETSLLAQIEYFKGGRQQTSGAIRLMVENGQVVFQVADQYRRDWTTLPTPDPSAPLEDGIGISLYNSPQNLQERISTLFNEIAYAMEIRAQYADN